MTKESKMIRFFKPRIPMPLDLNRKYEEKSNIRSTLHTVLLLSDSLKKNEESAKKISKLGTTLEKPRKLTDISSSCIRSKANTLSSRTSKIDIEGFSHAQLYLHRPFCDLDNNLGVMNIVLSNAENLSPTKDLNSRLNLKHTVSHNNYESSHNSSIHHKSNKKKSVKKFTALCKHSEFPKLKLQRKNCINFETLSSSDSLNSVLQDFKIDYADSHFNEKTNSVLKNTLKKRFENPRIIRHIDNSLIKYNNKLSSTLREKNSSITERTARDLKSFKSRNLVGGNDIQPKLSRDGVKEETIKLNTTVRKHRRFLSEINSEILQDNKLNINKQRDISNNSTTDSKLNNRIEYEGHKIIDYSDLLPLIKFDLNPQPLQVDHYLLIYDYVQRTEDNSTFKKRRAKKTKIFNGNPKSKTAQPTVEVVVRRQATMLRKYK